MADRTPKPSRRLSPEEKAARRAELDQLADTAQSRSRTLRFFGLLLMIALLGGGAYLIYQQNQKAQEPIVSDEPPTLVEQVKETLNLEKQDEKLTITEKILVPGALVDKTKSKGQKSKDYAEFLDPTYFLICEGDTTDQTFYYEINEDDFQKAFVGAKVSVTYTSNWSKLTQKVFRSKAQTP